MLLSKKNLLPSTFLIFSVLLLSACVKIEQEGEVSEKQLAKWPTYENEDFSFKYPEEWTIAETENQVSLQAPENQESEVLDVKILTFDTFASLPDNPDGLELRAWLEKNESDYFDGVVGQRKIEGEDAYVIYDLGGENGESTFIMAQHNGKVFEINFNVTNTEEDPYIRKAMFESFKWVL